LSNQPPVVDAGEDRVFGVDASSFLGGSVIDDGLPNPPDATTALWTQISGPAVAAITDPTQLVTSFSVPVSGTYGFRLSVTDGELTATDDVVQVADQAAVLDAGPDETIIFPAPAVLHGTVTDDGLPSPPIIVVSWMVIDGPGAVTFSDPSAASTTATFEKPGRYVLRFFGGDGAILSEDTVVVTVLSPNRAPIVIVRGPRRRDREGRQAVGLGAATAPKLSSTRRRTIRSSRPSTCDRHDQEHEAAAKDQPSDDSGQDGEPPPL
jgi:hypothetical protein